MENITKRIGSRQIIQGISFEIYPGEIFGFLGPNGSGKTTTIRMLVDLIRPTEGRIVICGHDVQKEHDQALQYIGAIVENPELYPYLTGWENLEHFARMLPGVREERLHEVAAIVGLDARIHDKVKTYSLGMRQRLGIAQALLNRPRLLILDEPTNGLDPQGIKELRDFIRKLAETGLSLFVSSHLLSEIEQLCDRVAIISQGKVIKTGEVSSLINSEVSTVVWRVAEPDAAQAEAHFRTAPDVQMVKAGPDENPALNHTTNEDGLQAPLLTASIETRMKPERVAAWNQRFAGDGISIYGIEVKRPTLEELFLELTEGERIG